METNFFAFDLTILIAFILLSISNITAACDTSGPTPMINSTQTNTNVPSNYTTQTYVTYIKTSCQSATYPSICYKSLYPYAMKIEANPFKLCNVSLSLALEAAYSASRTISKLLLENNYNLTETGEQVVRDCFDNLKESIGELRDSLDAMGKLEDHNGAYDREFQMSNIHTWVSAAITDDQTCYDGFDGENVDANVRDKIRSKVLNVARKTSNVLYFINKLSY